MAHHISTIHMQPSPLDHVYLPWVTLPAQSAQWLRHPLEASLGGAVSAKTRKGFDEELQSHRVVVTLS